MKSILKAWFTFLFILCLGFVFISATKYLWFGVIIFSFMSIALGTVVYTIRND